MEIVHDVVPLLGITGIEGCAVPLPTTVGYGVRVLVSVSVYGLVACKEITIVIVCIMCGAVEQYMYCT